MARDDVVLILGGPQGAGLETSSMILTTALAREGYGVLSDREYFSNIVGRHSYIHLVASASKLPRSLTYPVDLVAAMDAETVFTHFEDVGKGGWIVYDTGVSKTRLAAVPSMEREAAARVKARLAELGVGDTVEAVVKHLDEKGVTPVPLDYKLILDSLRSKYNITLGQAQRFRSSIVVGAVAGLMGLDVESVAYGIERRFAKRPKVVEMNRFLIERIMEDVEREYGTPLKMGRPKLNYGEFLVVTGNDVVAMGKAVGGVRYQSYYPITPASDESMLLEAKESLRANGETLGSIVVMQTEDEIAAIASAIGAALTGARSSTATSGPGFSLMVEGLGWAGMNEVPVVITYYQRGGPSTGLPTRGSQSDLLFSMFASHGEFPRIVMASGDHEEAFYDAIKAYNYAEKYQVPVIHLLDKFLANSMATLPIPDWSRIRIERGKTIVKAGNAGAVKRFSKESPISDRYVIGSGAITWYTGDEHDEWGHISEDPVNRAEMYEKRMKKLEVADREIPEEERAVLYGDGDADFLLVGWGFVKGVALDALEDLESMGYRGAYLHLRMFQPFPSRLVERILSGFDPSRVIAVEHNYMAQAAMVVAMNTGYRIRRAVLKWTGRPIYRMELVEAVKSILEGRSERVVLTYGQ